MPREVLGSTRLCFSLGDSWTDSASWQIQAATLPASRLPPKTSPSGYICAVRARNAVADIDVYIDFESGVKRVGTMHRHVRRGGEATSFEYHGDWLADPARFSLEPALTLGRGAFVPD